jgi:hypothetical protein
MSRSLGSNISDDNFFCNLSSEILDPKLLDILNKGPSFVNADPRKLSQLCLESKVSLQLAPDKLKEVNVPDHASNEFKGGIARIINETKRAGVHILNKNKLSCEPPPETIVITPSDKTKCLLALDATSYRDMVSKSTIDTGNYKPLKKLNLPRTEQLKFNKSLNKVAIKYNTNHSKLFYDLKTTICSEPMPCPVYCLPKDHKEGCLKGRPIHAATDAPDSSLSKFLARSLNSLLKHVPAHLKNTQEFINFLKGMDGESIYNFCSLDVCNLYGSIPLEDINPNTPSVIASCGH